MHCLKRIASNLKLEHQQMWKILKSHPYNGLKCIFENSGIFSEVTARYEWIFFWYKYWMCLKFRAHLKTYYGLHVNSIHGSRSAFRCKEFEVDKMTFPSHSAPVHQLSLKIWTKYKSKKNNPLIIFEALEYRSVSAKHYFSCIMTQSTCSK